MRRVAFVPAHLPLVLTALIVIWAAAGCAGSPLAANNSGFPTPVSSVSTTAALVAPTTTASATSAFGSGKSDIRFSSFAQGFRLSSPQSSPAAHLAVDPQSRDALAAMVAAEHQNLVKGVDLEKEAVLGVFWGAKPSGGFSIAVDKVSVAADGLAVSVTLNENDASVPKIDASTFPYHLVTFDRSSIAAKSGLHYRMLNGGVVLAEGDLP